MTGLQTLPEALRLRAEQAPSAPAIRFRRRGAWHTITASALDASVRRTAEALRAAGGPRPQVATCGRQHHAMVVLDLAVQALRGCTLALPSVMTAVEVAGAAVAAGARVVFCGDATLAAELGALPEQERPGIELLLVPDGTAIVLGAVRTVELTELGADVEAPAWTELEAGSREDQAFVGFSAGTSGAPRPVAWRQGQLLDAVTAVNDGGMLTGDDEVLCYFPVGHPLGRILGMYAPLVAGAALVFPEPGEVLVEDMATHSPTAIVTTARLPEYLMARHDVRLQSTDRGRRWIAGRALRTLTSGSGRRGVRQTLAMALVGRWVRQQLGLGRTRVIYALFEPVSPRVVRFFAGLGVKVCSPFGTADLGVLTFDDTGRGQGQGCGTALPGVQLRIDADGTVSAQVAWRQEAGWQSTGDPGQLSDAGVLYVDGYPRGADEDPDALDRPQTEVELRSSPYISRAVVGAGEDGAPVAYVEVDFQTTAAWAQAADVPHTSYRSLVEHTEVIRLIRAEVASRGVPAESLVILPRALDFGAAELTWLGTPRRSAVQQAFATAHLEPVEAP